MEHRLNSVLQSTSWRITAPVRLIGGMTYRARAAAREKRLRSAFKDRLRIYLQIAAQQIQKRPKLKRVVVCMLNLSPSLKARALAAIPSKPILAKVRAKKTTLTPAAEKIFRELQIAIQKNGNHPQ